MYIIKTSVTTQKWHVHPVYVYFNNYTELTCVYDNDNLYNYKYVTSVNEIVLLVKLVLVVGRLLNLSWWLRKILTGLIKWVIYGQLEEYDAMINCSIVSMSSDAISSRDVMMLLSVLVWVR